jgi:hypothetical protein
VDQGHAQAVYHAVQILWRHPDEAAARTVDVGDQHERDGRDKRQDQQQVATQLYRPHASRPAGC